TTGGSLRREAAHHGARRPAGPGLSGGDACGQTAGGGRGACDVAETGSSWILRSGESQNGAPGRRFPKCYEGSGGRRASECSGFAADAILLRAASAQLRRRQKIRRQKVRE